MGNDAPRRTPSEDCESQRRLKVLLIGYGNPGRLDDGLGPALAEALAELNLPDVTVDSDYQLTVEDASHVAEHDVVIFADADVAGLEPFSFKRISPKRDLSFTSHDVEPRAVLALAEELFGANTRGYALGIRGYDFNEFGEQLSLRAQSNLREAISFMENTLSSRDFSRYDEIQDELSASDGSSLDEERR